MTKILPIEESSRSPLRVVHYQERFGALTENWISSQIAGLDGHVVGVYTSVYKTGGTTQFRNLRCIERDLKGASGFANRIAERFIHRYPQWLFWLMKDRANIVHAHFGPCGGDMWPFTWFLGIPLVTSFYGYDAYMLPYAASCPSGLYRKLFKFGQLFLAEGSAMRNKLVELGCPEDKIVIHHIGVDPSQTQFNPRKPGSDIRLLVCGRFMEKKGIPYAVEALKLVRQSTGANVRLTVVGDSDRQGTMTSEKRKVINAIEGFNVGNAVSLVGFVSREELPRIIRDHHILVVPSVHASNGDAEGGFPVIITEALASGMPVVAFDHCDINEIVKDGECGFLAPEGDVELLAQCLSHLVDHPEIWPEMGQAGRAHVEANYSIDKLNNRLVDIYMELLQTRC
jgi:colanic acid/amylovoran biosynthesis glycosyltransferase